MFTHQTVFAEHSTQNPHYRILFTDMTRQVNQSWGRPGDPDPMLRGVNHFNLTGNAPEGSNEACLEGHVRWVAFLKFRSQSRLRLPSTLVRRVRVLLAQRAGGDHVAVTGWLDLFSLASRTGNHRPTGRKN